MSREIMIIAKNKDGVISNNIVKIGENGEHIVIKGTKDTFYEIKDMATNRAPDQIYTKRFKNDLKLKINPKGGALDGMGEADVTIENYCANGNCEIVGVHETGEYYQYVPQSGDAELMTTKMADGEFAYQSLGTVESSSWGPASLLPLAGLGGLGGGGGSKGDTTAPDAPSLTIVTDDYDGIPAATGVFWGADADTGSWNINNTTNSISISGNVNVTSDGKIITNDNTPTLSGTGEAGTIVRVYDGDIDPNDPTINLVGETTVANDGTWSVPTNELQPYSTIDGTTNASPLQNSEHIFNITLTDTAGNVSDPTTIDIIVDTLMTYWGGHFTYTNLDDGNTRDNKDVEVGDNHYFTGAFTMIDNFVAEGGSGELENIPYQEGSKVYLKLINQETGEEYLIGGPDGPTTTVGSDGSWSITIDPTQLYYNKTTNTMEKLLDGHYTNQVIVTEASGDFVSLSSGTFSSTTGISFGSFGIDTTAPEASQVVSGIASSADHYIQIDVKDSTNIYFFKGDQTDGVQRDSDYLTGLGVNQLIFYRDGEEVGEKYIWGNATSTTNWGDSTLSPGTNGVYMYQVKTVDVAGNESELSDNAWVLFDNDRSHDLAGIYNDSATVNSKDLTHMQLVGDGNNETFILDSVDFVSIDGAGNLSGGVDTFVLMGSGLILDIAKTKNFEVYNINDNKLTINGDVNADSDHIIINGTSSAEVGLSTDWSISASQTQSGYTIYTNVGSDDLWIQTGVNAIL